MLFKKTRGFTLVELLIVIAIIGLLASITLMGLNSAKIRAKDARTKGDVSQIVKAIGMYRAENNSYPTSSGTWKCLKPDGTMCWRTTYWGDTTIVNALAPYIPNIPKTQANSGCFLFDSYLYNNNSAGFGGYPAGAYIIWAKESGPFQSGECLGEASGPYDCGEYHCYQFIGANP